MEVNSSPGLEGIEKSTGIDVAGKIVAYIEKNAKPGKTKTKGRGEPATGHGYFARTHWVAIAVQ